MYSRTAYAAAAGLGLLIVGILLHALFDMVVVQVPLSLLAIMLAGVIIAGPGKGLLIGLVLGGVTFVADVLFARPEFFQRTADYDFLRWLLALAGGLLAASLAGGILGWAGGLMGRQFGWGKTSC